MMAPPMVAAPQIIEKPVPVPVPVESPYGPVVDPYAPPPSIGPQPYTYMEDPYALNAGDPYMTKGSGMGPEYGGYGGGYGNANGGMAYPVYEVDTPYGKEQYVGNPVSYGPANYGEQFGYYDYRGMY